MRAFHVYCNTMKSVPYVGQNIIFKCEYNNTHDKFAVAGKTLLKGRIAPITVGYVSRELSHLTWYEIHEGAQFEATTHNTKARASLLMQCWLEIRIKVKMDLALVEKLLLYITKVKEMKYLVIGEYVDDLKEIIKDFLGPETVESLDHDDDEEEELCETEDERCEDNEIIG